MTSRPAVAPTGAEHESAVAVVGLACRLPGASNPRAFWDLLRAGRDAVDTVPPGRWPDADEVLGRYPTGIRRGGFLDDVTGFDAAFFGISPREAAVVDPQQRLVLELAWEALEDAGTTPDAAAGRGTGVVIGAMADDYATLTRAAATSHTLTGLARAMLANRVSHALGLTGPSLTVDAAQASSLVAVHHACRLLRRGEADTVLTGGVNLNLTPVGSAVLAEFGALSPTGRCHTFDARADGYVRGEGGVVLVLRRLADALADGDRVYAVLAGGAVNHDGGGEGLTVPRADAQRDVIRLAHVDAGVTAADVDYVELHGTGTRAGDPVEAKALGAVFAGFGPLAVGSVKTNIGHLEGAAGAAGVLKAILAVHHGELPPSLHFETPNPDIDLDALGLRVVTELEPLPGVRTAGVSSFGIGGTNCHVVVRGAPAATPAPDVDSPGPVPLLLSARSAEALRESAARLSAHLASEAVPLPAVATTLATGRAAFEQRAVVLAADRDAAVRGLTALAEDRPSPSVVLGRAADPGRVVFVFPGQGSQWVGMALELAEQSPVFAARLADCAGALEPFCDWSLDDALHGRVSLDRVDVVQPVLFAVMVSLAALWRSWGIEPAAVVGHSQGEIAAACVSGALSLEDAARVVALRSQVLRRLAGRGGMVSVAAPEADVRARIASFGERISVAAVNGPSAVVVSGEPGALDELVAACDAEGVRAKRVAVDYASHSAQVEELREELAGVLAPIAPRVGVVPLYSTLTGLVEDGSALDAGYWFRNLRSTVGFADAVQSLVADGFGVFVECSPHPILSMAVRERADVVAVGSLRRDDGGLDRMLLSLGEAVVRGVTPKWTDVVPGGARVDLPTYPFQRTHHWLGGVAPVTTAAPTPPPPRARTARAGNGSDFVLAHTAAVLGHESPADVDATRTFRDLGFDSVMLEELRGRLADGSGRAVPGPVLFDHPTPDALSAWWAGGAAPEPVRAQPRRLDEPIAVVAMACRAPGGVSSPEELWDLVAAGVDAVSGPPTDRGWERALPGGTAALRGGFLHEAAAFDPELFGISPREAAAMDPQQRILLELAWEAFERAGIDPADLPGRGTGVFIGAIPQEYGPRMHRAGDDAAGYVLTGTTTSVASGRIAYQFGLDGPAITVDTACSSSLVALHLACRSLRAGETDTALAGGVTVMGAPGMFAEFARQGGLAPDGRCKAFASAADGTGWAEGAGLLVLRRLSDARRDGDPVLAVIRGSAVNQDGASNGLTAPSGLAQQRVIRAALADAGLAPSDVDVVEAHGTGTRLGDPVEAQAIMATYGADRPADRALALGSLKSNIGHAQAAAGVLGVIKVVQAMRHGVLPRTLHVDAPTPHVDWDAGRVALLTDARPWPELDRPRRAAVSSFGISGTNAHLVLEHAAEVPADPDPGPDRLVVWPLSGHSEAAVKAQAARLRSALDSSADPHAVARSLFARATLDHRAVVVGTTLDELLDGVTAVSGGRHGVATRGGTAFLFTGQGSQRVGMGRGLAASFPVFAEAWDEVLSHFPAEVREVLSSDDARIDETGFAQPGLFAVEVALSRLFASWGVTPDVVVGHSVGEIAAAHIAGVLSLEDACRVVVARGALMQALPRGGAMVAVEAAEDEVTLSEGVSLAAVNGPRSIVLSGDEESVLALAEGRRSKRLSVSHAFHSARMDAMLDDFRAVVSSVSFAEPEITLVSTVDDGSVADPEYWVRNVRQTVRFADAVAKLPDRGVVRCVEIGPDAVLTGLVDDLPCAPALRSGHDEVTAAVSALAAVHVSGAVVDWSSLVPGRVRRADLPTYAFQRTHHWLDPEDAPTAARSREDLVYRVRWAHRPDPDATVTGRWVVVVPDDVDHPAVGGLPVALARGGVDPVVLTAPAGAGRSDLADLLRPHLASAMAVLSLLALDERTTPSSGALALFQALQDLDAAVPTWLLTSGAVGTDPVDPPHSPAQAAVWGLSRVAKLESPHLWGGLLDLPEAVDGTVLDRVCRVLTAPGQEDQYAVRASGTRVRRLVRADLPAGEFHPGGTTLITGGTGALGAAVARDLADRGAEHLLLVGRRGPRAPGVADLVADLERRGARTTVAACDVA
ncbi:beta-ketoacyl synthase N-terminal-like domain-containing protein, partial [Actinosynnema sp. NPDC051121]